jgi:hypothetical protein
MEHARPTVEKSTMEAMRVLLKDDEGSEDEVESDIARPRLH